MLELSNRNTVLHLIDYFSKCGFTDNGICGLLGNLYAESGVRTNNLQNSYEKKWNVTDESYTYNVDKGTWKDPIDGKTFAFDRGGYGLAQWTSSGRKQGLLDLATELNKSIADESVQFQWLYTELTRSYRDVYKVLIDSSSTIESCAEIVVCRFEKPASVLADEESKQKTVNKRIGYAKEFATEFFGKGNVMGRNIVVAINAGHWLGNPKGVPKSMPVLGGTLEWTLNSRVVDKFVELAKQYDGITVVQNYDVTGKSLVNNELNDRIRMAEQAKADIYLSIHHNGGINGGTGGGTTIFYYQGNATNQRQATAMYNEIKARTGLKGNRSTPIKGTRDYIEVYKPTMNSYIIECAFMDSVVDVQYINKPEWPTQIAEGILAFLVKEFGFTKKVNSDTPKEEVEVKEETKEEVKTEPTTKEETKKETENVSASVPVTVGKVKVSAKTSVYSKTNSVADPGVYTITEIENGMGKLKSGIGYIPLANTKNV